MAEYLKTVTRLEAAQNALKAKLIQALEGWK